MNDEKEIFVPQFIYGSISNNRKQGYQIIGKSQNLLLPENKIIECFKHLGEFSADLQIGTYIFYACIDDFIIVANFSFDETDYIGRKNTLIGKGVILEKYQFKIFSYNPFLISNQFDLSDINKFAESHILQNCKLVKVLYSFDQVKNLYNQSRISQEIIIESLNYLLSGYPLLLPPNSKSFLELLYIMLPNNVKIQLNFSTFCNSYKSDNFFFNLFIHPHTDYNSFLATINSLNIANKQYTSKLVTSIENNIPNDYFTLIETFYSFNKQNVTCTKTERKPTENKKTIIPNRKSIKVIHLLFLILPFILGLIFIPPYFSYKSCLNTEDDITQSNEQKFLSFNKFVTDHSIFSQFTSSYEKIKKYRNLAEIERIEKIHNWSATDHEGRLKFSKDFLEYYPKSIYEEEVNELILKDSEYVDLKKLKSVLLTDIVLIEKIYSINLFLKKYPQTLYSSKLKIIKNKLIHNLEFLDYEQQIVRFKEEDYLSIYKFCKSNSNVIDRDLHSVYSDFIIWWEYLNSENYYSFNLQVNKIKPTNDFNFIEPLLNLSPKPITIIVNSTIDKLKLKIDNKFQTKDYKIKWKNGYDITISYFLEQGKEIFLTAKNRNLPIYWMNKEYDCKYYNLKFDLQTNNYIAFDRVEINYHSDNELKIDITK